MRLLPPIRGRVPVLRVAADISDLTGLLDLGSSELAPFYSSDLSLRGGGGLGTTVSAPFVWVTPHRGSLGYNYPCSCGWFKIEATQFGGQAHIKPS